jgi:hypothetical protein
MTLGGGCYCGKVRYEAAGTPMLRAQCHCRPCQYFSGGAANMFMLMPVDGFRYMKVSLANSNATISNAQSLENSAAIAARSSLRVAPASTPSSLRPEPSTIRPNTARARWRSTPATGRRSTASKKGYRSTRVCRHADASGDHTDAGLPHGERAKPAAIWQGAWSCCSLSSVETAW